MGQPSNETSHGQNSFWTQTDCKTCISQNFFKLCPQNSLEVWSQLLSFEN
jgi:hypothetical protein